MNNIDLDLKVKEANKQFYNIAANIYERVDGRRGARLPDWLDEKLRKIAKCSSGGTVLDVGSGAGWIARNVLGYFKNVVAIDISPIILQKVDQENIDKVVCDVEFMPFKNESFNTVICFSVLHHIYNIELLMKELHRILRKGGMLYSDHDIEKNFVKRFNIPLRIYRKFFDASQRYSKIDERLTKELYETSEIHSNGIDSNNIVAILNSIGFREIVVSYHWLGLNFITDKIFSKVTSKCSWAPILSVTARKDIDKSL